MGDENPPEARPATPPPSDATGKGQVPKLGPVPWRKFEKVLLKLGCVFVEQNRTSHRKYRRADLQRPIIVPVHNKDLPTMIIRSNLKTLGISREEYLEILSQV